MNLHTCTTRIYKDAEQRFTADGTSIVSFTGPVESGYGDKKVTTWIKFTLFGKRGDSLMPYLKDKTQIAVSGELANRKYQDKDGQDRYSLEVRVNDITLVGGKQEQGNAPQQEQKPQRNGQGAPRRSFDELCDTDVPF